MDYFVDSANGFEHKIVEVREAAKHLTTALYLVSLGRFVRPQQLYFPTIFNFGMIFKTQKVGKIIFDPLQVCLSDRQLREYKIAFHAAEKML